MADVQRTRCPLCETDRPDRKFRLLYGHPICHKCYYAFANRRQLGYIIDSVLWSGFQFALFAAIGAMIAAVVLSPDWDLIESLFQVGGWGLALVFIGKDMFQGRSPGKAICGVMVVEEVTFQPTGFKQSWKRNLPLVIPFVPLIVAFTLAKGHRWGDGWANTRVVWTKYRHHPVFTFTTDCRQCGYDLTGNISGHCPECGWELDENVKAHLQAPAADQQVDSHQPSGVKAD